MKCPRCEETLFRPHPYAPNFADSKAKVSVLWRCGYCGYEETKTLVPLERITESEEGCG